MKIVMTNHALDQRAGSESYLETVSTQLRRLGHEVVFFSPRCGALAGRFREDGFEVHDDPARVPRDADVIHGQHADAVGILRGHLASTPMVYAIHSWYLNSLEDPAPGLGAAAYLAFNDLTRRRLVAHVASRGPEVFRMTQPVEISHADGLRVPISARPQRAVAVSRRMSGLPVRLEKACAELGIVFDWIGGPGRDSADPRREVFAADIVVAIGRAALEAMAAGRAVLVADEATTGGWVSSENYASLEADGFTGFGNASSADDLEALLADYSPGLGVTARHLAVQHHAAQQHAVGLVELYASVADSSAAVHDAQSVALLAADRHALEERALRAEWATAQRDRESAVLVADLRDHLDRTRAGFEQALVEIATLRAEEERVRGQLDKLRRQRDRLRRQRAARREERGELPAEASGDGPASTEL